MATDKTRRTAVHFSRVVEACKVPFPPFLRPFLHDFAVNVGVGAGRTSYLEGA
jgi:hypothetical protein